MRILDNPKDIEARSFEIIDKYLAGSLFSRYEKEVAGRVVHASADLNYIRRLKFHPQAIKAGLTAIKNGKNIVTDVNMTKAGINKALLSRFGGRILCFIHDRIVIKDACRLKLTRSILAMRKAVKYLDGSIVVIGNAPTALFELSDLVKEKKARPALIIGLPVGFVGAKEAKKKLLTLKIPYITNTDRKGGSNVAAAAINALLKIAGREERR